MLEKLSPNDREEFLALLYLMRQRFSQEEIEHAKMRTDDYALPDTDEGFAISEVLHLAKNDSQQA